MRHHGCTGSSAVSEKICFALQCEITLLPGESKETVFFCGTTDKKEKIRPLTDRFFTSGGYMGELTAMRQKYAEICGGMTVETPDRELNYLLNYWLKYLTDLGSRFARVRHNGFRDMVSDTECLASFCPELARERIRRILTYQYSNGYAPRTFLGGILKDSRFADCTVWLTYAVRTIVLELGDLSFLEEQVAFNDGTAATVYEHLRRSVDFLYHFRGNHQLVRIWGGDWNDSIERAGLDGKGVSVWLTMALYRALREFAEIAKLTGHSEDAEEAAVRGAELRDLVDRYGWDDAGYYIYAYNDLDEKIGAPECESGKIFLNTQLWAVLSGIADRKKQEMAMESAGKYLRSDIGCAILWPPYTKWDPHIGDITLKAPGTLENGGVYLHTVAWKIAVDSLLQRNDLIEKDIRSILPFRNPVVAGRAEPYIFCNSYCTKDAGYRYGTPGQSWRTASGQWFLKAMTEYVFGLRACFAGLSVTPCLPPSFDRCHVEKHFRGSVYRIEYRNGAAKNGITVDGQLLGGNILPCEPGKIYHVTVDVKA